MARLAVLGLALFFILALAVLIVGVVYRSGFTLGNLVLVVPSLILLALLATGVLGALRKPPRDGR
ncbi:MAG: hypothetical protein ACYDA6_11040 [Solirubrobacteraceae bacterium]